MLELYYNRIEISSQYTKRQGWFSLKRNKLHDSDYSHRWFYLKLVIMALVIKLKITIDSCWKAQADGLCL